MKRELDNIPEPLESAKSYKQIVLNGLRQAIIEGRLPAGSQLKQDLVAIEYGVSRMPVREALIELQSEGLIDFPRHKIATVRRCSKNEIHEIFEIRRMLEGRAVELGVPQLSDADIANLELLHARMQQLEAWVPEWAALNHEFHSTMYLASGCRYMCELLARVQANLDRYLRIYLKERPTLMKSHQEHADILEACRMGSGATAGRLTAHHIWATAEALLNEIDAELKPIQSTIPRS